MKKLIITATLILFSLIITSKAFSFDDNNKDVGEYSHKLYENRDEARVVCGDFRVIAFSDYRIQGKKPDRQSQDIIRQYFEFTDLKNGSKKMVVFTYSLPKFDSNDKFIKNEDSYIGDHAYDWVCLKGKDAYYLAIEYSNGGNCYTCAWVDIVNRKGEVVDTSEDNPNHFRKTLSELGLPQISPFQANFKHNIRFKKVWLE